MTTMAPWQRGYDLARLSAIAARFQEFERGLNFGQFDTVREATVARWLDHGRLIERPGTWLVLHRAAQQKAVTDFTGDTRVWLEAGATVIERLAFEDAETAAQAVPAGPCLLLGRVEQPLVRAFAEALGLRHVGTKIRASSEMIGLFVRDLETEPQHPVDEIGLGRLDIAVDAESLAEQVDGRGDWVAHYSTYNLRRSWSALGLRTYGGDTEFIEKPSEMSKRWKSLHPDALEWHVVDTPLRAALPEVEPLLAAIPGEKQRVRLMRLTAGGALARHADITDREAGTADGKVMRVHIPLRSSPACRFRSWLLDGSVQREHLAVGEAWYLDTRKPHAASNAAESDRVHLVVDVVANETFRALLV